MYYINVPLEKTIEIFLKNHECKEMNTLINKKEMKQLLTLCIKNLTYDNTVYQQNDLVAMGSPLDQSYLEYL